MRHLATVFEADLRAFTPERGRTTVVGMSIPLVVLSLPHQQQYCLSVVRVE